MMAAAKQPKKPAKPKKTTAEAKKVAEDAVAEMTSDVHPGGRPTDYRDEFVKQAEKLCLLGATDDEIADFFEVSARTIYRWKLEHEEFCQALKSGKGHADERIERSLYQKASGFFYTEQQAFKIKVEQYKDEIEVVDVERFAQPDTTAQIFWLKNRRSQEWRDKQEVVVSGDLSAMLAKRRKKTSDA